MTTWGHPSPCFIKKLKHRAARDLPLFHGEGWRADLSPISHTALELGPKQYCLRVYSSAWALCFYGPGSVIRVSLNSQRLWFGQCMLTRVLGYPRKILVGSLRSLAHSCCAQATVTTVAHCAQGFWPPVLLPIGPSCPALHGETRISYSGLLFVFPLMPLLQVTGLSLAMVSLFAVAIMCWQSQPRNIKREVPEILSLLLLFSLFLFLGQGLR